MEEALKNDDRARWPLVVVHFDFKDNQPALLHALWDLLGQYQSWMTTAIKTPDSHSLAPFDIKPLMVLTEESDEQEAVFYNQL